MTPKHKGLLLSGARKGLSGKLVAACLAVVAIGVLAFVITNNRPNHFSPPDVETPKVAIQIVDSEELILELTVKLKKLNRDILDCQFPHSTEDSLFAERLPVTDIATQTPNLSLDSIRTTSFHFDFTALQEISKEEISLWQPVLDQLDADTFRDASFKIIRGQYDRQDSSDQHSESSTDHPKFETFTKFDGLARLKSGPWISIHATQKITWHKQKERWRIVGWEQQSFEFSRRDQLMFDDVFENAIPKPQHEHLLNSFHDQILVRLSQNESVEIPYPELEKFISIDSTMTHPSVSVVDINQDGWDDLYVMTRWRTNRLFVNNRDGTFREAAEEFGLDLDRTSSAVFADFDNDGDKDAFLGRCFAPSLLLIQEDGKFHDQTAERINEALPGFITSLSVADFDNDGLLDIYLSSYLVMEGQNQIEKNVNDFMPSNDATKLLDLLREMKPSEMWLKRPGPPNRLLKNLGQGKFAASDAIPEVCANTLQATWADFDADGDVDLYMCNDFAPDYLFRNDGEKGFKDITDETGGGAMRGYGMGASWGDYDNDGLQDLYVSNMYSKAGKRIINQLPQLDNGFFLSANGNRLFRNTNGSDFELSSGEGPEDQHVTQAGWSWGGQFCDFDNDGYLDIYVSSGFYTAPKDIACDEDL